MVVVDAAQSGVPPATVRRFDAGAAPLPARLLRSSTAVAAGDRLTPSVEHAAEKLASALAER